MKKRLGILVVGAALLGATAEADTVSVYDETDPFTNIRTTGVFVDTDDATARIGLLCKQGFVFFYFEHDEFITSGGNNFQFRYRIDEAEPGSVHFSALPDSRSGFLDFEGKPPRFKNLPAALIEGTEILVRISDYRDRTYDYTFRLDGFAPKTSALDCL